MAAEEEPGEPHSAKRRTLIGLGRETVLVAPTIQIVDHRAEWSEEFRRIGAVLRSELADTALRIDHVGSTSIPGLAAKDIIDIQVTVEDLDHPAIGEAFSAAGAASTEYTTDHAPPGSELDPGDLAKRVFVFEPPARRANVHVRRAGRFNQRYALLFRDYLRAHPATADAYAEIKRRLARRFPHDIDGYYEFKDPAIDLIMPAAEEWAGWIGWSPGPSDA